MSLGLAAWFSTFGLPLVVGWTAVRALGLRAADDRLAFFGWCWCAGSFLTGLVVFAWLWMAPETTSAVAPIVALIVLALFFALFARRTREPLPSEAACSPSRSFHPLERLFYGATTVLVLSVSAARILLGTLRPVVEDDEANFWALKAQMLFTSHGFGEAFRALATAPNRLYNADYPMLNPCLQVWTHANAGEIMHVANRLPMQLFGLAMIAILAAALRRTVRPSVAALYLVVFAGLFEFGSQLQRAHGDLMVGLGALMALDAWLRWSTEQRPQWRRLASFGLAFALWSKNEGLLFCVALLAAVCLAAVLRPATRRALRASLRPSWSWAWAALPLGVIALNHVLNAHYGWVSGFMAGAEREESVLGLLRVQFTTSIGPVVSYFTREIALRPTNSGGLLLLFLAVLLAFPRRLASGPLLVPGLAILAAYAGYMLVFVGAPHDLEWHLRTAAQRVAFQPLASVALWTAAAAGACLPPLSTSPRLEAA